MNSGRRCPNCGEEGLKAWNELTAEEQEVVKRLAASADYRTEDRQKTHRWCTRCWHESISKQIQT